MRRFLPYLLGLLLVLTLFVIGYAYLADLTPPDEPLVVPVDIYSEN